MSNDKVEKPEINYESETNYPNIIIKFKGAISANVLFSASLTTAVVTGIQNPLSVAIYSYTKGVPLPNIGIGLLPFAKTLYRGSAATIGAGLPKSALTIGGKNVTTAEIASADSIEGTAAHNLVAIEATDKSMAKNLSSKENTRQGLERWGIVSVLSLGDALLTQPETLADIRKAGLTSFKWYSPHNMYTIGRAGFGLRVVSSFTNTASMTIFQDYCADFFPKTKDNKTTNTAALASGAFSGFFAGLFTFVPSQLRDKIIVSAQINPETGQLNIKNTLEVLKESIGSLKNSSNQELIKYVRPILVARMMRSSATFMAVNFMFHSLGSTPFDDLMQKVGLFDEPTTPTDSNDSGTKFTPK